MKLLLINPPVINVIEPWNDTPPFGRNALATLAGYIRENVDCEIKIVDSKHQRLSFDNVIDEARAFNPDIIGITAFTSEIKPAGYIAKKLKFIFPDSITIIGGVHVTTLPEDTMHEFDGFDIGVIGEGEQTLLEICQMYAGAKSLEEISGIIYRKDTALQKTSPRKRILDLNQLPMPAWDLMPRSKAYYIQTERGCPFNCTFCVNHNGRVARKRSVELVIKEMEHLIRLGAEEVNFGDELFSVDMVRASEIMKEMIRTGISTKIKWKVQTHVKYVNKDLFQLFKKADVGEVYMGIETGDTAQMKSMGKGNNLDDVLNAFKWAKESGVKTGAFFIFGHPNETRSSMNNTINLAIKVNPDLPMFAVMVPFPGTKVAYLANRKEGGYSGLSYNWDDYRFRIGGAVTFDHISNRTFQYYLIKGYLGVLLLNFRIIDFFKFVLEYRLGALALIRKILKGKFVGDLNKYPKDYHELLSTKSQTDHSGLSQSYLDFNATQKEELVRTKKSAPFLFAEQKIIESDIA